VRAQENPGLTALQTLFVREHNYQVDQLHQEHPNWRVLCRRRLGLWVAGVW
jgi:Animal haem peroxidase